MKNLLEFGRGDTSPTEGREQNPREKAVGRLGEAERKRGEVSAASRGRGAAQVALVQGFFCVRECLLAPFNYVLE